MLGEGRDPVNIGLNGIQIDNKTVAAEGHLIIGRDNNEQLVAGALRNPYAL